ncbi:hypothetical protein DEJ19_021885 (plasmid) [Curtobacterium sp. MCSS17_016]|nr:hypothetical protein DEJ19_021885 [Curtobacterium sp. MCSS17_016]
MPAGPDWAEDIAEVVAGLRSRGGWSSKAFARSVNLVFRNSVKTVSEQGRLDQFMPGWRTNADEATLEDLRVGVGSLPVLARANAAGYDITADATAHPLLDVLNRHADDLAAHHRAALAALVPLPSRQTRQPSKQKHALHDSLRASVSSAPRQPPAQPSHAPVSAAAGVGKVFRPSRKLQPPTPSGSSPLAGKWVQATSDLITLNVFVVSVSDEAAAVKVWTPTTGRTRMIALAEWSLVVIDDPRR